jgi:hypothetical protein
MSDTEDLKARENITRLSDHPAFQQNTDDKVAGDASLPDFSKINSREDVIGWMNKYYWKVTLLGKVKYMSKRVPNKINFLDRKGLIEDTENLRMRVVSAETDKQTVLPWSRIWLESTSRNGLDEVIFHPDPNYVPKPLVYNFWQGYGLKPVQVMLRHLLI